MRKPLLSSSILAVAVAAACATPPTQEPFEATQVRVGPGQEVAVDQVVVIFDSSGSINPQEDFPGEKALLRSFVAGMPDGKYSAQTVAFGGSTRDATGLGRFSRESLATHAKDVRYLGEYSPLDDVISEAADRLDGRKGTAAVIIFSDGEPTIRGTARSSEQVLAAARDLIERHDGPVCIHTVETGSGGGAELLAELSALTDCGTAESYASIGDPSSLHAYQQTVFLGQAALPAVSAAPPPGASDLDADGVPDAKDMCLGTPKGARVDSHGCWELNSLNFASDSNSVGAADMADVDEIVSVMKENPDLRIRIDGHADSTGSSAYNQTLSESRARMLKTSLEERGIDGSRLETVGMGSHHPVASNKTRDGRQANRRIEISILR